MGDLAELSHRIDPHDKDGVPGRREIPEESGALACVGFDWPTIIQALAGRLNDAAPEIKHRETAWIVRARRNGIRIEFYEDEDALARRLDRETAATELKDGLQVHAGRLTWW